MLVFLLVGKAEEVAMWDVRVYEDVASIVMGRVIPETGALLRKPVVSGLRYELCGNAL